MHRYWTFMLIAFVLIIMPVSPTAGQENYSDNHPRIFFTENDIARLREQATSTHRGMWLAIKQYVDSQLGTKPPVTAPVLGTEDDYRNFGNQPIAFAFACVIAEDPAYCDLTRDYLLTYAKWQQWDEPARRDLGLAHMLLGNAIAYDWIYDYLTPEERRTVRDAIALWAHRMNQASSDGYREEWTNWWIYSFIQNHFSTNHSALGIAGLVLKDDVPPAPNEPVNCTVIAEGNINLRWEPSTTLDIADAMDEGQATTAVAQITGDDGNVWWQTRREMWLRSDVVREEGDCDALPLPEWVNPEAWIERASGQISMLVSLLDGTADGTWHEGLNYQNYMLTLLLPFLINLRELEGEDLFPEEYLQNYVDWRLYNYVPDSVEYLMTMSDTERWWGNAYNSQAVLRFLAREYDDAHAQWLADQIVLADGWGGGAYISAWIVFEFFYYDPAVPSQPPTDVPLSRTFPDLEGLIWRTGWEADDLIFGMRTGAYGGRYNYETFTQGLFPWDLPCDADGCTFNTGHDHGDANTFYLQRGRTVLATEEAGWGLRDTEFHNTVRIDGEGQVRPPADGILAPNLVEGTDGSLQVSVSRPDFDFAVADATNRYEAEGLENYTRHVLFVRPEYLVMVDNFVANTEHDYEWISHLGGTVRVDDRWIRGDAANQQVLGIQVLAPEQIDITIDPTGDDRLTRVRIDTGNRAANNRFVMLLYPTTAENWEMRPEVTVLANNYQETALRVQSEVTGRTDDILLGMLLAGLYFDDSPYAHDMRGAVVSYREPGKLERLFAYGGTFITDQILGITLISNLYGYETFEAVYYEDTVEIYADRVVGITLYAPNVTRAVVNGVDVPFERDGDMITFPMGTPTPQAEATESSE